MEKKDEHRADSNKLDVTCKRLLTDEDFTLDLKLRIKKTKDQLTLSGKTPSEKGIAWIRNHRAPGGGIVVHHKTSVATPEVTGYIIETLYNYGETEFAYELARWEASVQRADGSFGAPNSDV